MGAIRWYKRDPDAALQGMFELNLEERGAYNTVLDLIYAKANKLPDDDRFVAGWLRVDVRVWKRLKSRLIELGKLRLEAGFIRNERADVEVDAALSRVLSARDAGLASGAKRASKSHTKANDNNELNGTIVDLSLQRPSQLTTTRVREEKEEKEKEPIGSKKKTAWREGVPPKPEWVAWAVEHKGWSPTAAQREAQRFVDYAMANGKLYQSWDAGWRQWCTSPFQKTEPTKQQALTL